MTMAQVMAMVRGVHDLTCGPENFARSIEQLVGDIPVACGDGIEKAVQKSTRKGVKTVKGYAKTGGVHKWSEEYVGGFRSKTKRMGLESEGEIGNKAKPGLVHLLEKGHATLTGRRTRAFPHLAPAFEEISDDFVEQVKKYVGEAIR